MYVRKELMLFSSILSFFYWLGVASFANASAVDDSRILGNATYAERIHGMKKNRFRDSEAEKNYLDPAAAAAFAY
jgi:hypothetical protein